MEEDSDDSYPDEYYYYNDDYEDDDKDCGFWDGIPTSRTYCGFRPSFLYSPDYNLPTFNYVTKEQADKNAEELLQEEKREKEKADKKRLKKKRQKDRKREQRQKEAERPAGEAELAPVDSTRTTDSGTQDRVQDEGGEVGNEDDLDLASSFVRQAQKKMENKPKPERKERDKERVRDKSADGAHERREPPATQRSERSEELYKVEESIDLANVGNKLASRGSYVEALHYYSEAIRLNPNEYRFLGNRSYSYEHVGRYKEALQDAEKSLELQPNFIKGHFRKGKALKGLKRYDEAITAFQEVLSCHVHHEEAAQEVVDCQQKLQELTVSTKESVPCLMSQQPTSPSSLVHNSSDRVFIPRTVVYTRSHGGQSAARNVSAAKPPSSALYPIWVGNITSTITEDMLRSKFAAFGAIHSFRILYSRTCAFVNFTSKAAAESAFRALQGLNIDGTTLVLQLRNPEHSNLNAGGGARKLEK